MAAMAAMAALTVEREIPHHMNSDSMMIEAVR